MNRLVRRYRRPIKKSGSMDRISHVVRGNNNNALVFDTLDEVLLKNPGAQPLFHSDRRFQYTNREFHTKLVNAGITQSMSRGAKCIDNGPMEGF